MTGGVHLGFEVGTGQPVEIPIAHMVVTGQTQAAGKTTTLEALVQRSGVRAMAFRTKRGEGGFQETGKRIAPYFRERADWRFVSAILEASLGERMKFERSWIMRATKGARTLADVQANVRSLGAKAKGGMSADMFMMLGEYLDGVVPELQRVDFAPRVGLYKGANVVDLGGLSVNVQGLVISSMLSWVHEKEDGVVAVLPEAWKFLPQGRNSPVRMAAIAYAREGGELGNLIWLDSQDLAGAEKEVVRQASVYLLGVQREANELKRTLDHIPAGVKKPKAADIATLERGQFYACWGTHAVKVYVQPAWMSHEEAREIATGGQQLTKPPKRWRQTTEEHGAPVFTDDQPLHEEETMNPAQEKKLDRLIDAVTTLTETMKTPAAVSIHTTFPDEDPDRVARRAGELIGENARTIAARAQVGVTAEQLGELEFFEKVLAWLQERKPHLLRVMLEQSEMVVEVEKIEIRANGDTLRGRIARLIQGGELDEPSESRAVIALLAARGGPASDRAHTGNELKWFASKGFLTIEPGGYKAVKGMKIRIVER